ncbi:MAG: tRNA (adenosine(37)-N6)-threonylcarbamoyltransferase complex ATPase subunit type 1 TsaE [Chromatiales bacterium]|jgi:tRNA threonylcarbamoyladenosine biosynthesis protein TsaE|nr:tRNA (adenosine(37)-N6)-threonylcarbamoyltransferase complex ATPase subunit type 1 TsaE [Chromatiales bacterium]MDP6149744.1 tRNA (adenosine(37)-N6)-threonylcarbamoyltransferase complex ATPase subunit type 1 TsaE [Gammaproteobacteria bacterium]MDP7270807.1 tRNA (adenosine(37)-N6)-threonylcarbamoyltransferase complex ATPase subunit type 1 TsaE [Gammaproteobacteria bacterium]HJP04856.1 tRNA (adenosine(37)-N6)-threonylcarbamoyltransferase complex ATPase subunit type 1 TsaE [Gammaproteobacteria b
MTLETAAATEAAGAEFAAAVLDSMPDSLCIGLEGDLGAGKTTFARGFIRGFGHTGRVPSPTYTLVEPYDYSDYRIFHLDLYRIEQGAELEYLGLSEMTGPGKLLLVEWPSRACEALPPVDIRIVLKVIPRGRTIEFTALSPAGKSVFDCQPGAGAVRDA